MQIRIALTAGSPARGERLRAALTRSGHEARLVPAAGLPREDEDGSSDIGVIDVAGLPDASRLAGALAERVPVLVIGASEDLRVLEDAVAAGADDLAVDPGDEELASRIRLLLQRGRRETVHRGETTPFESAAGPGGTSGSTLDLPGAPGTAAVGRRSRKRPAVLLVEDDADTLDLLAALLEDGFDLLRARDGEAGVRMARRERPDVILLDLGLPRLDGFGALAELRRAEATAEIPVIFLSAEHDEWVRARGLRLGAADFVVKPFAAAELRARIDGVLEATRRQAQLRALAQLDALTGLPNFGAFRARLEAEVKRSRRYRHDLSAVMLDMDNLKPINDQLGHAAGNRAIVAVAGAIRAELRETDFAARYGGDEFVILLPHADSTHARVLAERLRRAVRGIEIDGGAIPLRASFGVASTGPRADVGGEVLLRAADAALYLAKRTGRDRVCVAGEDGAPDWRVEGALHEA